MKSSAKIVQSMVITLLMIIATLPSAVYLGFSAPGLELTTSTEKSEYYLREKVIAMGNVTFDGSPISNAFVALEMHSQPPYNVPMAYRTVTIGNPNETWVLDIMDISVLDLSSPPNRLNTVKVGNRVKLSVTVYNPQLSTRDHVYVTISMFDGNLVPLRPYKSPDNSILPQSNLTVISDEILIPTWAYSGVATIYANVYSALPVNGGVPYAPEKSVQIDISRSEQGFFSYSFAESPNPPSETSIGEYSLALRLPPTLTPGTYSLYSSARYRDVVIYTAQSSTTFDVLYAPLPPTASFTWLPPYPYPNTTVTFDASSSSPEGHNDTITRYEWDWGDGTPRNTTSSPTITHKFMESRQYIVTLNVTDNEGLWSLTQKPITIKQTNPLAAFTWTPDTPIFNTTVSFDASASQPGWSISTASPAPIDQYVWNFGDGTGNFTLSSPTLDHIYQTPGNFTVLLEVIDTENQRNSITHTVQVRNVTAYPWDINGDNKCDIKDIAIVAKAYGSEPGYPNWNPQADITGPTPLVPDGKVDIRDVSLVAKHYGETYS